MGNDQPNRIRLAIHLRHRWYCRCCSGCMVIWKEQGGQQMPKLRLMLSQLTRPLSNHKPPVISKPQSLRLPKMQTKRISLFLITLLVTACGNQSTTPTIKYINVDSACTALTNHHHGADPDVMDARTVKAINAHNDKWDSLCENEGEI